MNESSEEFTQQPSPESISKGKINILEEMKKGQKNLLDAELRIPNKNSWPQCATIRLSVLVGNVGLMKNEGAITEADYEAVIQKTDNLEKELDELHETFPEKMARPPTAIQNQVLLSLKKLAGEIIARSEGTYIEKPESENIMAIKGILRNLDQNLIEVEGFEGSSWAKAMGNQLNALYGNLQLIENTKKLSGETIRVLNEEMRALIKRTQALQLTEDQHFIEEEKVEIKATFIEIAGEIIKAYEELQS